MIIEYFDVRFYLCSDHISQLRPAYAEMSHCVTGFKSTIVKLLKKRCNICKQLTFYSGNFYLGYVSIADLLHAKVLLVVLQGSIKVANSIHSMQKSPCILHVITNMSCLSTQMLLSF